MENPTTEPSDALPPRQWTVRDIPHAVELAFDLQKLSVGTLGLFSACFLYGIFSWLGDLTGEKAAHRVFTVLGAIVATCISVLFSGLIARMTTVQLLENRKASAAEMRTFARDRGMTLMAVPLAFGGIAIVMLIGEAALSIVGSVPGIGPIVFSASFLLAFAMSLVTVLAALVHMIGAFLYPTIVAMRGGGAMGAMLEVVELARRQPLHLILYEAIVGAVGGLMTVIISLVVWASVNMTTVTAAAIMGERFDQSLAAIPRFFRIFLKPFESFLPLPVEGAAVAWHYDLSGFLLGGSLLVLVVVTLVYPFVFFTSAGSITYLILRPDPVARERSPIEDL